MDVGSVGGGNPQIQVNLQRQAGEQQEKVTEKLISSTSSSSVSAPGLGARLNIFA